MAKRKTQKRQKRLKKPKNRTYRKRINRNKKIKGG